MRHYNIQKQQLRLVGLKLAADAPIEATMIGRKTISKIGFTNVMLTDLQIEQLHHSVLVLGADNVVREDSCNATVEVVAAPMQDAPTADAPVSSVDDKIEISIEDKAAAIAATAVLNDSDGRVDCPFCDRKFNRSKTTERALTKHLVEDHAGVLV